MPVPQEKEMPETFFVSDVVEGISVEMVKLVPRARVQQRTAGKIEVVPQYPEKTVEMVKFSQERVQQRSAEIIEVLPQSPEETVEVVKTALQDRSEAIKVPKISRQRSVEVVKTTHHPPRSGFLHGVRWCSVTVSLPRQTRMSFRNGYLRGCVTRSAENICSVTSSCGDWMHAELYRSCSRRVEVSKNACVECC